ncbi:MULTISPECIES: head completion/stabilization protein [unclassified Undibacterium]|uniref:head completion/stabilization protein n=1 Tax=unclassified Undibacterium TaxID=2630295 RepID=UPI002AC9408F|nr:MULTISPECIES: head completion/stabilization protein [unclassified Undibacterium]MEB0138006.1 head completion/stabilization protein [Undibacterium sp. CCC2.1]MEB0170661.1 head completion/stabilization protein [Undibacterium sp. CCC1.1]MEB0177002.1 head completion/stabilization protein [Undibacterium sp. CCC3.4]MEB0216290.1 head completion/stabilization protein [Undibacterium sp. 5I2]WPX42476.1 head completion/stabilization protein [Undibacterium sp. CCC3.4]
MSFIAIAPSNQASAPAAGLIINDGWFPDIRLADMREAARIDGTVTDARLTAALVDAILSVNLALHAWKAQHLAAQYADLLSVPAPSIQGESQYLAHYRRAVYSTAKADLLEKYRDFDSTGQAQSDKKAIEWLAAAPEQERRNAHWAIANILQRPHMTVELI